MADTLLLERIGAVQCIIFNRPEKKNAFLQEMYVAFERALKDADTDESVRAVVLLAEGDAFSSGNDVADFGKQANIDIMEAPVMKLLHAANNFRKPLIAGVNGLAVGIGVTILLHCDLVYAVPEATFKTPFVDLALVPEAGSSLLLPAAIGPAKAADMLLRSRKLSAEEADKAGLISEILPAEHFREAVLQRAAEVAAKAPTALAITKDLLKQNRAQIAERMNLEAGYFAERLASPELAEAVTAFIEKRPPDFSKAG